MFYNWKSLLIFHILCAYSSIASLTSEHLNDHWDNFKTRYNKTYESKTIENNRRSAWEKNYELIKKHNEEHKQGLHTYKLDLNHLADLSHKQYLKSVVQQPKITIKPRNREITAAAHHNLTLHIPDELDWRKEGLITKPMNQEDCGSCYAFSVASCVQGQYFLKHKKVVNFSVQQLVDCSISKGNLGCYGGSLRNTLKYLQSVEGLMLEDEYPYLARQNICKFRRSQAAVKIQSWKILPPKDENFLKYYLATIGPLAVSIDSTPITFQLYSQGIYDDGECSSDAVNHAMLLVGYTKNAWILKNWWTAEWGEDGYMYLARGKNRCSVANYAAYLHIDVLSKMNKISFA